HAVYHVVSRLADRRRELVLHDLDLRADADRLGAVFDRVLTADVEPDRGVELQRAAAGRRLGRVVNDHTVRKIGVMALDLEIEAMTVPTRRLRISLGDRDRPDPQLTGKRERVLCVVDRMPCEATTLAGVQLAVHRGMYVGRNEPMKPCGLLRAEPESATIIARSA